MKRFLLPLLLAGYCAASSLTANQGGTAIAPGDFVDLTSTITGLTGTTIPYYQTGWDKYMYVPAIDAYCGVGSYFQPSSEPNQNWSCYLFTQNRWFMTTLAGLFADEHLQEGGHPMGTVQVDPTISEALGFQGASGSQVSNQTKYGMWRFDFLAQVGRPQQPPMGATSVNQLGTCTYDTARRLENCFGGDGAAQGYFQYDNNPAHSTATSNGYNAYNTWALEMSSVTLNGLSNAATQASMAYNTSDGLTYLYGGFWSSAGQSGVRTYTPGTAGAAGTWSSPLSLTCHDFLGGNNCPVGRINAGFAYDAVDNIFLMSGGALPNTSSGSPQTPLNDTWVLDPVALTWTQIAFTNLTAHTFGYQESHQPLTANILSTDTSFSINAGYPYTLTCSAVQNCILQIESEFILCTAQTGQTTFSSCTRGYENTTPAAHTLGVAVYNSAPLSESNERLTWLPEHNIFIIVTQPVYSTSGAQMHLYAFTYAPGENAGYISGTYNYSTPAVTTGVSIGPLNRNTTGAANQGWVVGESVASDGTNLFISHTETATKQKAASPANSWLPHPYTQQFAGAGTCGLSSGFTCIGASYSSMSPDQSSNATNSFAISNTVIGGNPWAYWYQTCVTTTCGGGTSLATIAMGFGGSTWGTGAQIPVTATVGRDGPGQIINVGGTPTAIYMEQDHDGSISGNQNPYAIWCYVSQWNGTSWATIGGAALNSGYSVCESPTIATDGTNIWAAFTLHGVAFSSTANYNGIWIGPPQLQLWKWNGSTWTQQGASGNVVGSGCTGFTTGSAPPTPVGTGCSRAFSPSLTVVGGVPYIALAERTDQQTIQKLELVKFSGGAWSTVVADLRRDTNAGWAFRPECTTDATSIYCTWDEQGNPQPWLSGLTLNAPRGQKSKVFADKISTAGVVTILGGAWNADTVSGSATHPSIAVYNANPVVAWGEVNLGSTRQLYAKMWNGTDAVAITAPVSGIGGSSTGGAVTTGGGVTKQIYLK